MFRVMQPFVINVPTRDLLVPYTERSFQIMAGTLALQCNVCKHETSLLFHMLIKSKNNCVLVSLTKISVFPVSASGDMSSFVLKQPNLCLVSWADVVDSMKCLVDLLWAHIRHFDPACNLIVNFSLLFCSFIIYSSKELPRSSHERTQNIPPFSKQHCSVLLKICLEEDELEEWTEKITAVLSITVKS